MKKILFLSILITMFSIAVFADIRLPDNIKPTPETKSNPNKKEKNILLMIRVNPNVNEPTLRIPRSAVKDLRAQLDEIEGNDANYASGFNISRTQTLMSGLFLSAAFIFGGVWALRGKSLGKNQKIVSGLLIFTFLGASAFTVFANVAPPPLQGLNGSLFSDKMKNSWRGAVGNVKVEIDEKSSSKTVELVIPRSEGDSSVNREE